MSTTTAQSGELARTAQRFDSVSDSLRSRLVRLMTELDVLQSEWQGAGGRSFTQVKEAWARDQGQLCDSLSETATAMRGAAGQYANTDASASDRLRVSTGAPVVLPL